ncbi:hypothetical protein AA106555_1401 [Neokomagataea thailandica NBRC 106555]|uniref:Transmembrane protein n=2 Tax=Neokomagataea TaxID=1223423 RepID=A0A4Y6V7A7_9PROT|nr:MULTISPECIES: hypothetical protein [Neokomagataea]QDH24738.1 hypothetical protein D5366_05280 [Neokomagataea tanensis]GBR53711.1 hypothetical protein AA106555_1401 [Neokomagataea thailandica NBRC 106555]
MFEANSETRISQGVLPKLRWWHGVFLGAGVVYCPGTLLVITVLLLPLGVLWLTDRGFSRQRLVVMLFYVGAVMVRPLHHVWLAQGAWYACFRIVQDQTLLILDWGAIAVAWIVSEVSTMVARYIGAQRARSERAKLELRIKALEDEWSLSSS